jgi:hypothetical protein
MKGGKPMDFWVVKCREKKANGKQGWHWDNYFVKGCSVSNGWGGDDWIKNNESKKYIRDEVGKGDLVVCYQYEGQEIMGLTSIVRDGAEEVKNSGNYNLLFFTGFKSAFEIDPPLTIRLLRDTGCNPKCFGRGRQGTVFPLNPKEFKGILSAITDSYPQKRKSLEHWLTKVGYRLRA